MILKVIGYGTPLLRKKSEKIDPDYQGLQELIQNMYETMYNSNGVGLAAPQIGLNIRLFVIDDTESEENGKGIKKAFINPQIIELSGEKVSFEEGCLSVPKIREDVIREEKVTLYYQDENFNEFTETFDGLNARVIQHEYDHLEGVIFIDKISYLRKRMIQKKLQNIINGNITVDYPIKFAQKLKK